MENNETWRERLAALLRNRNDEGNLDTEPQEFFDLFATELLSLADKIGAENRESISSLGDIDGAWVSGFNAAISLAEDCLRKTAKL